MNTTTTPATPTTQITEPTPTHRHCRADTHSNGRAPAAPARTPVADPGRFDFEGLKAQRQRIYAERANQASRAIQPIATPTRITAATSQGTYNGAELRPYSGRPDAMHAHSLPSRTGTRLHWPDGRVTTIASHTAASPKATS